MGLQVWKFLFFGFVLLMSPNAVAGFDEALAAYTSKDYEKAMNEWGPLAAQGDPKSQMGLGLIYLNGNGVAKDETQAAYWFRKAAEKGNAKAQVQLAVMYFNGQGVNKDIIEAYKWLNIAGVKGHPDRIKISEQVEKSMTAEELSEAKKRLEESIKKRSGCAKAP